MSKKCRAYSESRLGLEPSDNRKAFYTGWDAALREALAEQPAQQQEPVPDTLYFAQWTAAKKDLSDYIHVGSLLLAGIEDGEYGTSEIDPFDNTIEALQEKLVTGSDHKKVPLLAYIGELNSTSPPASKPWVGLTDEEFAAMWMQSNIYGTNREKAIALGRAIEAKLKEKNA